MNSAADEIIPPISLGYLAETVKDKHFVKIVDCLKEQINYDDVAKLSKDFDAAGITLFTKDLSLCKKYLKALKSANKDIVTFVGGPHPSAVPKETLLFFDKLCDYVFVGESEVSFPKFVSYLENKDVDLKDIEGLCYTKDGEIIQNPSICPENIDNFKIAWELIPPDTYPQAPHGAFYKQYPFAPIITSRGCPFHCTFCGGHIISGYRIRQRSIVNVLDEIKLLYHTYGVKEIHIEDDNFTFNKNYVIEFCKNIKEMFPDLTWTCPNGVRIDTLDEEMLYAMKSAGCYALSLGIESGNDDTLKAMKKSLTIEKIKQKIEIIKKSNLDINAFFILGYPGETKKHIENTINFALSLPLKRASFANFQPLPGTIAYHELIDKGLLKIDHWENFNPSLQATIWSPPGLTTKELSWYRRKALLKFYLRPHIIKDFVKGIKSFSHFIYILKRAIRWLTFTGKKQNK